MDSEPNLSPSNDGRRPAGGRGQARRRGAIGLAALVLVTAIAALGWPSVIREVQDRVYDNRPSGFACADLPTMQAVERALAKHQDLVLRIEAVGDEVSVDPNVPCRQSHPDAPEVLVTYPGGADRGNIEELLNEESFGVPTSLQNI